MFTFPDGPAEPPGQKPAAARRSAWGRFGMGSTSETAVLVRLTPSMARIEVVIRYRSRVFFATTCTSRSASPVV
jgi:hypothetical protein